MAAFGDQEVGAYIRRSIALPQRRRDRWRGWVRQRTRYAPKRPRLGSSPRSIGQTGSAKAGDKPLEDGLVAIRGALAP
jgi:hypothetical protein